MSTIALVSRSYLNVFVFPPTWLRLMALLLSASLVFALFYLGSRPMSVALLHAPWDKLLHLVFYGGISGMFWVMLGGRGKLADFGAVCLVMLIGGADEIMQSFLAHRHGSSADYAFDLLGALIAVGVLSGARKKWRR